MTGPGAGLLAGSYYLPSGPPNDGRKKQAWTKIHSPYCNVSRNARKILVGKIPQPENHYMEFYTMSGEKVKRGARAATSASGET